MENHSINSVYVTGGEKLSGSVAVQGSKNAALPVIAATTLVRGETTLYNVPDISDVHAMLEIMESLGASFTFELNKLTIDTSLLENVTIDDELTNKLRASSLLLGPLLAVFGQARVGAPGGCHIGARPLNYHFEGFEGLNSHTSIEHGVMVVESSSVEGEFHLDFPSVGATQNLISASVFSGKSVILRNIAIEPEVMALVEFLQSAGANINVLEDNGIQINGVPSLSPPEYTIPFDRIEAGTLLVAAFATKGDVTLRRVNPNHMTTVLQKFRDMGAYVEVTPDTIHLRYQGKIHGVNIRTDVHPGFPTDMQSQFSVLMTRADSFSVITETIFTNRFRHLDEITKLSGNVEIKKDMAIIHPSTLSACPIKGYDLRGAASMVLAGLISKGTTRVEGLKYMNRGYENFLEKLTHLGAVITYPEENATEASYSSDVSTVG